MTNTETKETPKKSKKRLLALLLLLLIGAGITAAYLLTRPAPPKSGLEYEANVVVGSLTESKEERLARLQQQVDEGSLLISINGTPCTASDGSGDVNWNIENLNEGKLIRVEVYREDTSEVVFSTGAIKPDNSLPVGKLTASMAPGAYPCVAMFYSYRENTEAFIGQGGASITLTVS